MGLIVDSSVLITAERRRMTAKQALEWISAQVRDEDLALSAITVMELTHGIERAKDSLTAAIRTRFLSEIENVLDVYAVSAGIAARAGRIDGASMAIGFRIATADLLIGATALHLNLGVATRNVRHFKMIPMLRVVEL